MSLLTSRRYRLNIFDSDYEQYAAAVSSSSSSDNEEINVDRKIINISCQKLKRFNRIYKPTRLAVIDLEDTLVNKNFKIFPNADMFLMNLYRNKWYIIIWTEKNLSQVQKFLRENTNICPYIGDCMAGLINGSKPVNKARHKAKEKLATYLAENLLIDSKAKTYEKSQYDFTYHIALYQRYKSSSLKNSSIDQSYIDYTHLWNRIRHDVDC